jgi:xanthine dehydrogenase iron-sulfur cluster and FAD-binding subunit A
VAAARPVTFELNGKPCRAVVDARTTLLDWLREQAGLTRTKKGCNEGACGTCTVLVDGTPMNACLALVAQCEDHRVVTIEGIAAPDGTPHPDFAYASASDRNSVVTALSEPGTAIIAGGTELLNWMRLGIQSPKRGVDIGGLHDLEQITSDGQRLMIGARATLNAVGEHEQVRGHAGALAEACLRAASAQVRNRATIGGNVLQKTRGAYFRADTPLPWGCNKREAGSGCAARHDLNERHAIFGWTDDCVAVQPSDPAVALACLDAEVQVLGRVAAARSR